jgi:hypothetical protein
MRFNNRLLAPVTDPDLSRAMSCSCKTQFSGSAVYCADEVWRQRNAGTRFEEERQLHLPQCHKATEQDSTLRVDMNSLEEQADNAKARNLYWKPLSWLGTIRPTSAEGLL